jgi:hypothetical protein
LADCEQTCRLERLLLGEQITYSEKLCVGHPKKMRVDWHQSRKIRAEQALYDIINPESANSSPRREHTLSIRHGDHCDI